MRAENQLVNAFLSWRDNKELSSKEMSDTLDRIILSTLRSKYRSTQLYHKTEDFDDLLQDIRYICLRRLANVQPPYTNKRIYNYLSLSIKMYLKEKTRNTCKKLDKEKVEHHLTPAGSGSIETSSFFLDPTLDTILNYRFAGLHWTEIKQKLSLSTRELNRLRKEMEHRYYEKTAI